MIKNIFRGIRSYSKSFKLLSELNLWKYFFIPTIISIILAITIIVIAYSLSDNIGEVIAKIWIWDWGKSGFTNISTVIGGFSVFIIGLIIYKHAVMALSAPFMSPVSEKIEQHLTNSETHHHRKTNFAQQLFRAIRLNLRNLLYELALSLPLMLLSLIPVVGIVFIILLYLTQAYYAGFGNMDYTLERHFNYKDSLTFVKERKGIAIGNGLIFILFLLIPFAGVLIALPLSVTAASIKTTELLQDQRTGDLTSL